MFICSEGGGGWWGGGGGGGGGLSKLKSCDIISGSPSLECRSPMCGIIIIIL